MRGGYEGHPNLDFTRFFVLNSEALTPTYVE